MIYCFLAEGFEEVEALTPVDILRRCGKEVVTVGIGEEVITGAHGISVCTDITEVELVPDDEIEMIILPGGMPGTLNLEKSRTVQDAIDYCALNDKYIAAICAAPSILGHKHLLDGKKATCFPGFEEQMNGAVMTGEKVVVADKIITAKGAGASMEFGLKLAEILCGKARADKLAASMQWG
ncbi:MAG: DJ-1 family glyoxalase III [Ruminiclostridium sp.]